MQHQLEDLSRNKFALILPEYWVFRDKDKDYGIDGEVEIFDSSGKPTGLVFWVQLKATSSERQSTITNLDFSIEAIRYYKQLDIPVLIARYSKHEDLFYVKWASEIDLFYAKISAKTMRISFSKQDSLNAGKVDDIEKYLNNLRALKSGIIHMPIGIRLSFNNKSICGLAPSLLLSRIRLKIGDFDNVLKLEIDPERLAAEVIIDDSTLRVGFLNVVGCTFHSVDAMEVSTLAESLLKDISLGLALSLSQLGYNDLAARVVFSCDLQNRLKLKHEVLHHLLPSLLQTSYLNETLDLVNEVTGQVDNNFLEIITHIGLLLSRDSADKEKLVSIESFLKKNIERYKESSPSAYGISLYNLGNFYRSLNRSREAAQNYLIARRYEPAYCNESYFYGELAGCLFEMGRFLFAAKFYKRSLDLKYDDSILPLYADSLLFSGEYQKSLEIFEVYINEKEKPNSEWLLKTSCLSTLVKDNHVDSQCRNIQTAMELANVCSLGKDKVKEQLEKVLEEDFLCGLAWFNLGQTYAETDQAEEAAFCFTMAGLVQTNDCEAWVNATLCSFSNFSNTEFLILVVRTAYFINGERFLEALYENIVSNGGTNELPKFSEGIEQIISYEKQTKSIPEIRMKTEAGMFQNIISIIEEK